MSEAAGLFIRRPAATEYAPAFGNYVRLAPEGDVPAFLEGQLEELLGLLGGLSEKQSLARHAPYTWSVKEVVGHIADCERIFGYRLLRIARKDATPLASFDENTYMSAAEFDRWPFAELLKEFDYIRRSHLLLLRNLPPDAWTRIGVVNDHPMSVRAMAFVLAGHAKHHLDILHKRLGRG